MIATATRTVLVVALLAAVGSASGYAGRKTYSGFAVYRCQPQTSDQLGRLQELTGGQVIEGLEFWTEPYRLNGTVDIMAAPEADDELRQYLFKWRIPTRKMMYDVGEVIRRTSIVRPESQSSYRNLNQSSVRAADGSLEASVFFSKYNSYSTIEAKLRQLARDPRVSLELAGRSTENRRLYLVKVSSDAGANKPVILIDALHHAREWISLTTSMYLMESLVSEQMPQRVKSQASAESANELEAGGQSAASLLDHFDFWFVPTVNPDGYEYTRTTDRLWRKTRSRHAFCVGVDPNRNYPFHWRESGASANSCSEIYAGPSPLSEPETKAVAGIMDSNKGRIRMYLSLHCYSQMLLTPYGHKQMYPDNYKELQRVAEVAKRSIQSVRGTEYRYGPSAIVLYPAAGGSDDYAHAEANIRYAYTMELPDEGRHGFLLPAEEIIPVGQETLAGLTAMVSAIQA